MSGKDKIQAVGIGRIRCLDGSKYAEKRGQVGRT